MSRHHYAEVKFLRRGERLRDFVFGYNDGAVTTLAVIVALTTAGVENFIIILGALANVFGAGVAFTLGDYMSVKSQFNFMKTYSSDRKLSSHEKGEIKDIVKQFDNPMKIALVALVAFMISGSIAMLPFLFIVGNNALIASISMVFVSVFLVGLIRARYTHRNKMKSGFEMLVVAGLAMAAAYSVGYVLSVLGVA